MDALTPEANFDTLSVKDLLEARETYHWHLMHKDNVIGTAVGRYLIRDSDPWPSSKAPTERLAVPLQRVRPPRTLLNSAIRPYSWPCVLAFVKQWITDDEFGGTGSRRPENRIPSTLYLPDGRVIPVCVVEAPMEVAPATPPIEWHWPDHLIGGGFPIVVEVQGRERVASVGGLVTDGHKVYALTNRHVIGEPGTPVYAWLAGQRERVGSASKLQIGRRPFQDLYPEFLGARTLVNLDIGLIEVDDVNRWTTQVYGIGTTGPLADVSTRNLSVKLIGERVTAYGAASGRLQGRIAALFYRYQTLAGHDLVADFLISPERPGGAASRPGDSGTLWHWDPRPGEALPRPLAVQWGGHVISDGGGQGVGYALATSLSNVCQTLEVDLVADWNAGTVPYWGMLGHYAIGTYAVSAVASPNLRKLMSANLTRISFAPMALNREDLDAALQEADFVPLADVPDLVWKKRERGKSRGPAENPTHYADVDEPAKDPGGKTLLELCLANPARVNVDFWKDHYDAQGHTDARSRGLLPFRVWQFHTAMVKAAKAGDVDRFVCAAGILSHYVGDACQPLHGSWLNDGYPDGSGKGVHSCYETQMLDYFALELSQHLTQALGTLGPATPAAGSGQGAAVATVRLMADTQATIPPAAIVDAFIAAGGKANKSAATALWATFGERTGEVMARGAWMLAALWESAWAEGRGDAIAASKLRAVAKSRLRTLYLDKTFVPSKTLDDVAPFLT